jgi:hypothetical protein
MVVRGRQRVTHLGDELERPQARRVIEDLGGYHQLVRAGPLDNRFDPTPHDRRPADDGEGEGVIDARLLRRRHQPVEAVDRRLQRARASAPQVRELLLDRGEELLRLAVGVGREHADADHRVGLRQ